MARCIVVAERTYEIIEHARGGGWWIVADGWLSAHYRGDPPEEERVIAGPFIFKSDALAHVFDVQARQRAISGRRG
jgi:hypothetical protein